MCKGKCGFDLDGEVFDDADFETGDTYDDPDDSNTKAKVNVEDWNRRWNTKVRIIPKTMDDMDIYVDLRTCLKGLVDLPERFPTPKLTQIPENKGMERDESTIFDDDDEATTEDKKDIERDDSKFWDDYDEEDGLFQSEDECTDDEGKFN